MRHILSPAGLRELDAFLDPSTVFVFDYDGTLAPIVDRPSDAHLAARTYALLHSLSLSVRCVLLTGRALSQVEPFIHGIPFFERIGNHGAEWTRHPHAALPDPARREVLRAAAAIAGAVIEDKRLSMSVHTRAIPHAQDRDVLCARLAAIPGVKIIPGKRVLNVLPAFAPNKGDAVRELHHDLGGCRVLFAGDDVTDEAVFALGEPWLFSVRVAELLGSSARHFLRSQSEMDRLLSWLVARYGARDDPARHAER